MLRRERLGWHEALPNLLSGPDANVLRRTFSSLQTWLDFPIIGLQGSVAAFAAGNTTVAWATELYDDYNLHDTSATTIRAPQQARQFFCVGAFTGAWSDGGGAAGRRVFSWVLNGSLTRWRNSNDTAAGLSYLTCPFFGVVPKSATLAARVEHDAAVNLGVSSMELWLVFFPLGG